MYRLPSFVYTDYSFYRVGKLSLAVSWIEQFYYAHPVYTLSGTLVCSTILSWLSLARLPKVSRSLLLPIAFCVQRLWLVKGYDGWPDWLRVLLDVLLEDPNLIHELTRTRSDGREPATNPRLNSTFIHINEEAPASGYNVSKLHYLWFMSKLTRKVCSVLLIWKSWQPSQTSRTSNQSQRK